MKNDRHPSKAELVQLLDNESDELVLTDTTEHLKQCETCQQELDSLAAKPGQWHKALQILKDAEVAGSWTCMQPGTLSSTVKIPNENSSWQYSLPEMLDQPKHPELLGRIGEFDIECEVGRGGMGIVFKAFDSKLHRVVAIKILAPHLAGNGTARKRFAQEAIAAAGVIHPNVIAVHGVNDQCKSPFIVMPFVDGISLQTLVENQGPLAEIDIARIALQISAGLSAAHSQGLVHRDIKPANILVETGVNRVVITDFGLARAVDDASMTQTGWLTGTPNYMAPEQTRGQRPDHRSDLFSLGSTLYFLATGHLPFRAETPLGVLHRIQNETPTPVRQINHEISATTAALIDQLLAKQPGDRFQSAAELHGVLEKLLAHLYRPDESQPPQIRAGSKRTNAFWTPKRLKQIVVIGVMSVVALVVVGTVFTLTGVFSNFRPFGRLTEIRINQSPNNGFISLDYSKRDSDAELLMDSANNFLLLKRYDEAIELYLEASKFPEHAPQASYNLGCTWALKGDPDKAFTALSSAIDLGFEQEKLFRTDDDLNSLRSDPRFELLLQRLK